MSAEQDTTDAGGLSRRQSITRGAIAGGLIWAAPVIRTTAAYATTANGTEKPCQNFYMVVINPDGHVLPAPTQTQGHEVPPAIRHWFTDNPGVTVQYPSVKPQLTAVSNEEAAVLLAAVTGPNAAGRQCRMVLGFARKGNSFSEAFVDPDPPIAVAVGRRLIFPCPRSTQSDSVGAADVSGSAAVADSTTTSTSTTTTTTTTATPDAIASQAIDSTIAADNQGGNSQGGNGNQDGNSQGNQGGNSQGNQGGNQGGNSQGNQGGNGNGSGDQGNGHCFDALYLIYCCPR